MRGFRSYVVHRRVVVNLWSGTAIAGVVVRDRGSYLAIRDAVVHEPDSEPVRADGEIIVDRWQVDFIQAT